MYLVGLADDNVGPQSGPGLLPQLDHRGVVRGQVHLHNIKSTYKSRACFYDGECALVNLTSNTLPCYSSSS